MKYSRWKDEPLLDNMQIEMLVGSMEDGDLDLLKELKELYCQETAAQLQRLQDALRTEDEGGQKKLAHAIAGSSANLGFLRLSKLMRHIENDAVESAELVKLSAELESVYEESLQALDRIMGGAGNK